jgi:hypothetical protein
MASPNDSRPHRNTPSEKREGGWHRVADVLDKIDYQPCPHCHRPSWTYVAYLLELEREDAFEEVAWQEFMDIDVEQRHKIRAFVDALRAEDPRKGKRLVVMP